MDEYPETRYVAVGEADVAYQVVGDGPFDLLYFYGLGSHIEVFWYVPEFVEFLQRLASFSRLIFFDRRGTGASDGVPRNAIPTWEEWTEAVLGLWMIASPWLVKFSGLVTARNTAVATGIIILVLALWVLATDKDYRHWAHDRTSA